MLQTQATATAVMTSRPGFHKSRASGRRDHSIFYGDVQNSEVAPRFLENQCSPAQDSCFTSLCGNNVRTGS